ncbi:MAG: asparaginase domain-containing protein [bacterium]|nr:asparaginase domain-containing protein [bacterium]
MGQPVVRIIGTGGTIDSESETSDTKKSLFSETHIPEMLQEARITSEVIFEPLMMKDSLDLTEQDRQLILERCSSCPERNIVITHGTSAMEETAKYLGQNILNKTVILVGAIVPYNLDESDALFNLGYAIASAQQLPSGVYIAMNGKVFPWNDVRKNREKLVFENLEKTVE